MTFDKDIIKALSGKLNPEHVKERSQSGRKLSYIEGWHAIAEANRIFGFDAWNRETVDIRLVQERERTVGQGTGWGVTYIARVRVTVGSIIREGVGSGHGIDRDLGLAHESAIKEAETDAMKRALMTFGNPFGLALYDKGQSNVGVDPPELSASAKVMIAVLDTLDRREDVSEWVFANKVEAEKLADGAAVLAHARARFRSLPDMAGEEAA
jgi:DNA repair and recombination protein RAD52